MSSCTDSDPIEVGFAFQVLQAIEHFAHVVRGAMAGQEQKLLPELVPVERLLRCAFEPGHRPPQHAAILQRDRDGCGKRRRAVVVDRNGHPLAQRPDSRVAQRRFVEGAGVARVETWASATQNGMLYCAIMMSAGE